MAKERVSVRPVASRSVQADDAGGASRYPLGLTLVYSDGLVRAGEQVDLTRRASALLGHDQRLFPGGPIEDPRVGPRHAMISEVDGRWRIICRGHKNGTFLNGQRVAKEHPLTPGDVIRIGSTFIVFGHIALKQRSLMINGLGRAMAEVEATVRAIPFDANPVLLLGEVGTGKELVAHELHRLSARTGSFIKVDCASHQADDLERELFGAAESESAAAGHLVEPRGGTLFLESASHIPMALQERLAAAIEAGEHEAPARIIAATHEDITRSEHFEPRLRALLTRHVVQLPPLRERREDLGVLARVLLGRYGSKLDITPELMDAILASDWPLNIRGLIDVLATARNTQPKSLRLDLDDAVRKAFLSQTLPRESSFVDALPGTEA